jgi:hypothetical protein
MNKILKELNIIEDEKENNVVKNLTKTPKREPQKVMPRIYAPKKDVSHQADLLHLPNDKGYKYLLVVVDTATSMVDAEPLKSKDSDEVKKAMAKIYKRRYLNIPLRLEVDLGSEFKGDFKKYFDKLLNIVTKVAGRHRQQALVETKNYQIGKNLNTRMLVEEVNNGIESRSWVDIIPKVIKLMNYYLVHEARDTDPNAPVRANKFSSKLLDVGTRVRIQLDNPQSYVDDKKLHGSFRAGDIRWSKTIHKITQIYLRPAQPPMYQIDNDTNVAYTKYQLQVVKDNEVTPSVTSQNLFVVKKLLKRVKLKNRIYFEVLWFDDSKTLEPRSQLIQDVPLLVKEFEKKS